jgi:hypothetical protein
MRRRFHSTLACAAWLAATAAMAQTPVRSSTARASGDVQKQAFDFVQTYAASTAKIDQIPRWRDPICVQVVGLPADQAAQVKARVEAVAKAVGVSAQPAGCAGNVEIAFSAQPQAQLDSFMAGRDWLLGYDNLNPRVRTVTLPIQAWYVTATDGDSTGANTAFVEMPQNVAAGRGLPTQTLQRVIDRPDSWPPNGCADSRFSSCLQSALINAFIIVDTGRVMGRSVGVLSDYVAMLALSQPRSLGACQTLPSVTDLLVAGCPGGAADGLTPADAAYLTALYAANLEAKKPGEQIDIASRMAKILAPEDAAAR